MADMFDIDDHEISELVDKLEVFAHRSIPFAARFTLTRIAHQAKEYAKENVRNSMILRNKFTENSIRAQGATGNNMRTMESRMGSIQPYMLTQEEGGIETKTGKHGIPIPTREASGEGRGSAPRQRLPKIINRLGVIKLKRRRVKGRTKRQRNLLKIYQAVDSGSKLVYLDTSRNKGIYRITGGRKLKSGKRGKMRLNMIYNLKRTSVVVPANPTIEPAADRARLDGAQFAKEALIEQAKRQRLR